MSVPAPSVPPMQAHAPPHGPSAQAWDSFRASVRRQAAGLPVPPARSAGNCRACQGPARPGYARCFQCELHAQSAPGLLADCVVPVAYAAKGGQLAHDLWLYKAGRPDERGGRDAAAALCCWCSCATTGAAYGGTPGVAFPTHACVVPSGRGRTGPHPLQALVVPFLTLPWVSLRPRPGGDPWARALDPGRFQAGAAAARGGGPASRRHVGIGRQCAIGSCGTQTGWCAGGGGRGTRAGTCPASDGPVASAGWAESCAVHVAGVPAARAQVNRLDA